MQAHRLKNATGGGGIGSRMKGGLSCSAGAELANKVFGMGKNSDSVSTSENVKGSL